ncbi:MAG: phosphate/phosphite/phosphonate ABC transporter substrate-binding protein [Deltaproteobacteria bacterium]|nr:phosphate/phosphite/phosphonate ABC transporter substrate-binding protein [Deltaproteobacteria bacterium]
MDTGSKKANHFGQAFTLSILLCCGFLLSPVSLAQADPLVLATLNSTPSNEIKRLLPFSNYIAQRLQMQEVDKVKLRVEKNIIKIGQLIQEDKVDIYFGNPFTALALNRLSGMKFLLQALSQGADRHPSVIFVKSNSAMKKLTDLQGRKIAFEDPLSAEGYLLPKWLLMEKGLKLKLLKKVTDEVGMGELGYIFSRDDINTLLWVKKGKVDAGAVDSHIYAKQAKESLDQLRIIEKTISLPSLLIGYRSDLSPKLLTRLKFVLQNMHKTDEGKVILKDLDEISKFVEIPPNALDPLLKANKYLNSEFNFQ